MSDIYNFRFDEIPEHYTTNYFRPNFTVNKCTHNRISSTILKQNDNVDKVINRLENIIKYEETVKFLSMIENKKETKWYKAGNTLHWKL